MIQNVMGYKNGVVKKKKIIKINMNNMLSGCEEKMKRKK